MFSLIPVCYIFDITNPSYKLPIFYFVFYIVIYDCYTLCILNVTQATAAVVASELAEQTVKKSDDKVCVCVCVCMCVLCLCVCVCVYVYMYVCMYMCVSVCVCMCVCMCICVCMCAFIHVCRCVCTCVYLRSCNDSSFPMLTQSAL